VTGLPVSRYRPAIVAGTNLCFRPDYPSVCVWVDSDQPSVLRISVDAEAVDFDAAIRAGRTALNEAAASVALNGRPVRVVAMTEEAQAGWHA
jgi:hypothetical protein